MPARVSAPCILSAFLAGAVLLAGCSGAPATSSSAASAAPGATSADGYPVSVQNCGRTLTISSPPQRIFGANQSSTEILLALGAGPRMVGTSTWFDAVLPQLAPANEKVKRIADNNPSLEAVLGTEPDLIAATYHADLPGEGKSTIESMAQLGIPVYMSPSECAKAAGGTGDGRRETPLTMDIVYQEIEELGRVIGSAARGRELAASVREQMTQASASQPGTGKTVAFWFANSESPYVAGGYGAPEISAKALGATNVFAGSHDEWPQVSWEAFAEKNPDVIVLGDLTRKRQTTETGAAKVAFLEKNPVTRQMKAVKNKSYVFLTGSDMNGGLRVPVATKKLADGFRKLSGGTATAQGTAGQQ